MTKPVVNLTDYNPDWTITFEMEKKRIIESLGDKVLGIEHIGSTSIKGLGAKPIIDIILGVLIINEVEAIIDPLKKLNTIMFINLNL